MLIVKESIFHLIWVYLQRVCVSLMCKYVSMVLFQQKELRNKTKMNHPHPLKISIKILPAPPTLKALLQSFSFYKLYICLPVAQNKFSFEKLMGLQVVRKSCNSSFQ